MVDVPQHIADGKPVIGLVISRGYNAKYASAAIVTRDRIYQLDIKQLGFE